MTRTVDQGELMGKARPGPMRRSRWLKRFALCAGSLVAAVCIAEGAVRILGSGPPVYAPRHFEPQKGIPFTKMEKGPVVYQPNVTFWSVYDPAGDRRGYFGPDGKVVYEINPYGMRGPAVPVEKETGVFRIVCLGDSITFGEGVQYADTYPARLAELMSAAMAGRRVEVINAGVQAYGTKDEAALFLLRGLRFKPDVVTLEFFLNDAMPFAETIHQNEAMTTDFTLSWPARISRICEIVERGRRAAGLQEEYFDAIRRSFRSPEWNDCREVLKGLQQVAREDRFRLVVVIFPVLWDLDGKYPFEDIHGRIAEACREAGCEFIDLLAILRGRQAQELWVHPTDQHPNEIAHRLAAAAIAERLTGQAQASPEQRPLR